MGLRKLCLVFFIVYTLQKSSAVEDDVSLQNDNIKDSENIKELSELIKDFEIAHKAARKVDRKRMRKLDRDIRNLQVESITGTFLQLNKLIANENYCNEFIVLNGIEKTIMPALDFPDDDVKADALLLLRTIFEVIPKYARHEIPEAVLENIINIFQQAGSFPVKRRILDILSIWLPQNPTVQAKVIAMKGIEIFYDQLVNLDSDAVNTVLQLFISILEEHLEAMKEIGPQTEKENELSNGYKAVGLINYISSKNICNGLVGTLDNVWIDREIHIPLMCQLLKIMKPFCLRKLKGENKYLQNFEEIVNFVDNNSNKNSFDNLTDVKMTIQAYKNVMAGKHTEL